MASVPDTATFSLQDVVDVVNPTTDDLADCLSDAITAYYDPDYNNDTYAPANSLLRFRNYGDSQGGYGYLYNWYAAKHANFAPTGWHVPTIAEFSALATELGGSTVAGGKMKEVGFTHWSSPNTGATNSSHFTLTGVGYRSGNGTFESINTEAHLWTNDGLPYYSSVDYNTAVLSLNYFGGANYGHAVRLIKDDSTDPGYLIDYDYNFYSTIKIGTQVWTVENFRCTRFNDGTAMTKVTANSTWAAAGTSNYYYCSYDNNDAYSNIHQQSFVVPNATYNISKSGGSTTHNFNCTIDGTVSITQYSSWLSGSYITMYGLGYVGTLTLVYTANDAGARTGTVTITNSTTGAQMVVTVSQAKGYVLTLSVSNLSFSQAGLETKTSTVTISPTSTTPTITDDQTWILTSYNSDTKVITVSMSSPNTTGSSRSGTITVRHPSDSSLTKYITVTQLAH